MQVLEAGYPDFVIAPGDWHEESKRMLLNAIKAVSLAGQTRGRELTGCACS